jgi:hypothetical protein
VAGRAAGGVGGAERGVTEKCPECGRIVSDAEALREWLALETVVDADPESCGLCRWRYGLLPRRTTGDGTDEGTRNRS